MHGFMVTMLSRGLYHWAGSLFRKAAVCVWTPKVEGGPIFPSTGDLALLVLAKNEMKHFLLIKTVNHEW
jgi:hypothetical protein